MVSLSTLKGKKRMPSNPSDAHQAATAIKHAADLLPIGAGGATIAAYINNLINPILTMVFLLLSAVWTYYKIKHLRAEIAMIREAKQDE